MASDCSWSYSEYSSAASSGDGHTWVVNIQCGNGGICTEYVECIENGQTGFVHDVYMDGTDVGDVCVPEEEVEQIDIGALAIEEFKRIAWPESALVVQPPDGKTLVNFKTNFYTLDNKTVSQSLTIVGRSVTIRATPTTYAFHFGDGDSTSTASPGRPHPDLDVTHEYARKGDVVVSLDTTYTGEYRIGNGDWVSIPDALTVPGAGLDLQVVEALPQLVLR
ncbi:hypothetical protein GCM10009797_29530 [Nocardioides hwasunensis]